MGYPTSHLLMDMEFETTNQTQLSVKIVRVQLTIDQIKKMSSSKEVQQVLKKLNETVETWNQEISRRENDFNQLMEQSKKYEFKDGQIIELNIGGKLFSVQKETLMQKIRNFNIDEEDEKEGTSLYYEPHMLSVLVSGFHSLTLDKNGAIFIDR